MNPLKPVRFYGGALPRPRYLDDVTHERVDPPAPVNDSLLRWAQDANWSMGGLSFRKIRMQGKIEGRLSKLKNYAEDDDEEDRKEAKKKCKSSPGKPSPAAALKKVSPKPLKRKAKSGPMKGRRGKAALESPTSPKKLAAVYPLGEWGEENGPSPRRVSPRLHASTPLSMLSPLKPLSQTPPSTAMAPTVSVSVEFPVQRRRVERALPDAEDSDSDVNWEEFSRLRDQPLRRSSRVTSIRRSFKEFAVASDSEHDIETVSPL